MWQRNFWRGKPGLLVIVVCAVRDKLSRVSRRKCAIRHYDIAESGNWSERCNRELHRIQTAQIAYTHRLYRLDA